MKAKDTILDKLLMSKVFYIVVTLLFIGGFALIFKWQHIICWFDKDYVVDNELLGTFGDFIGGVLGTIFALISTLIMIRTFNQQRIVTDKNQEQIENQRFNDLFFELLHLYQSEISELSGMDERKRGNNIEVIRYTDKDFFDFEKELVQRAFRPTTSYYGNIRSAVKIYMLFYIKHRTKVAACFRTLYRMYDLIDKADLKEDVKKNYLKIIRAQLTDSELFFLRYNGMTYYGQNFLNYMNKYHVLKHLPAFELLEFKDWWKDLTKVERMGINIVFHHSTRILRRILMKTNKGIVFSPQKECQKYRFEIKTISNYLVEVTLKIDNNKTNNIMEYKGLEKFTDKRIQALLDCYLKETFIYSNFERYNKEDDLKFYSDPIITKDGVTLIKSGVENIKKKPLKLSESLSGC